MKDARIGYLISFTLEDNYYLGGFMITDQYGIPLDFKYTEPIRPTKIQKILYGSALEKYLKKEVVFGNLLNSSAVKLDLLVTFKNDLLDLGTLSYPAVSLEQTVLPPFSEVGQEETINEKEFLLQIASSGSPVRIMILPEKSTEKFKITSLLLELQSTMNLTEPLTRVEGALKEICREMEKR